MISLRQTNPTDKNEQEYCAPSELGVRYPLPMRTNMAILGIMAKSKKRRRYGNDWHSNALVS